MGRTLEYYMLKSGVSLGHTEMAMLDDCLSVLVCYFCNVVAPCLMCV